MRTESVDGVTVVRMDPNYSGLNEGLLAEAERQLLEMVDVADPPVIVLDMSNTEFFSSTFIETLFRVWHRANVRGGKLVLAGLQPFCLEVLQTARLTSLWRVEPSVDDAVRALAAA